MVHVLTRTLAVACARPGIRVYAVCPVCFSTDMTAELRHSGRITDRFPQVRFGQPDEVAPAMVFFASPLASHITSSSTATPGPPRPDCGPRWSPGSKGSKTHVARQSCVRCRGRRPRVPDLAGVVPCYNGGSALGVRHYHRRNWALTDCACCSWWDQVRVVDTCARQELGRLPHTERRSRGERAERAARDRSLHTPLESSRRAGVHP